MMMNWILDHMRTRQTWEEVADTLVLVTGSSDPDAFKAMISAHKNRFARVRNKRCYEVAEMYNEGLEKRHNFKNCPRYWIWR